ncbi:AraC family transcriptional regulator [Pseudomonas paraeruginosa]|uniref:AraC family transcriptional regulator n=1 Tax=Pseudomonas paraeruginosa TaxID=2994495 RepID=UPI003D2CB07E
MPKHQNIVLPDADAFFDIFESTRVKSGNVVTRALRGGEVYDVAFAPAGFHFVEGDHCSLRLVGAKSSTALKPGDLIILPHNRPHLLECSLGDAWITTGEFRLEGPSGKLLTNLLPVQLRLSDVDKPPLAFPDTPLDWLSVTLAAIRLEAGRPTLGSSVMLSRLIDLLFVWALRHWLATSAIQESSWMRGLNDAVVGRALMLLHAHPARTWSVDLLAREVNQSRSGFSQRFASVMGESPMRYLTRTRMHIAADFLETTDLRVSQIAQRVGYESEPAFSRAFRRQMGTTPVDFRMSFKTQRSEV